MVAIIKIIILVWYAKLIYIVIAIQLCFSLIASYEIFEIYRFTRDAMHNTLSTIISAFDSRRTRMLPSSIRETSERDAVKNNPSANLNLSREARLHLHRIIQPRGCRLHSINRRYRVINPRFYECAFSRVCLAKINIFSSLLHSITRYRSPSKLTTITNMS